MEFTARGLIKKGKSYAKDWDDLYEIEKRNDKFKKSRFKTRYKDDIAKVTFESKGRSYTYMVASQKLAKNKVESDLQKIAKGNMIKRVKTNSYIAREAKRNKMISTVFAILADMVYYQWDGKYQLIDSMVVEMEDTGEVVFSDVKIISLINDCPFSGVERPEDVAWSLLIDIKCKVDNVVVGVHTNNFGETFYQVTRKN